MGFSIHEANKITFKCVGSISYAALADRPINVTVYPPNHFRDVICGPH